MTDQLRQALALWHADRDLPPKGPVVDITPIVTAAEAWLEFPSDAQVEAAARAIYKEDSSTQHTPWERWVAQSRDGGRSYRKTARAALEAARNTNGTTTWKDTVIEAMRGETPIG